MANDTSPLRYENAYGGGRVGVSGQLTATEKAGILTIRKSSLFYCGMFFRHFWSEPLGGFDGEFKVENT